MKSISFMKFTVLPALALVLLISGCTFDTSGPTPPDHNNYSPCQDDVDCGSGNCENDRGFCVAPACDDGRQNGDESAPDCGGSCPSCPDKTTCRVPEDCAGQSCHEGFCQPDHCVNDQIDLDESDVDCGRACAPCDTGALCGSAADCRSRVCELGVCLAVSCADEILNGDEVDVDCGGACGPCPDGLACRGDADCENGVCTHDVCQPLTCVNDQLDGDETDLDCGGACVGCDLHGNCLESTDCRAGLVCFDTACRQSVLVDFDAAGGATPAPESKTVVVDEVYGALATTARAGHTFDGWWTAPDGGGARVTADTVVTAVEDHTLFASWTAEVRTVTFDAQGGGALTPGSKTVTFGEPYGELATTARAGYVFDGWWTGAGGTGAWVTADTVVTIAGDHTLYAKWLPVTVTVTFDANGGAAPVPESAVVTFGAPYGELATTSRAGYTFGGWWTGAGGTGAQITTDTLVANAADHTLYAKWTANTYTVTFDANGGAAPSPASKVVTFGATYGTLATTARTGYTFGGWWTGAGGTGAEVLASTTVTATANHTLYARWTANTYTVTFDANGGVAPTPASKIVTFSLTYGTLATTSRTGYTFGGWWTGAGGTGAQVLSTTTVTTASNHTLYARWIANTYTVTFDAEGGTAPNPATKSVTFGAPYGALATTTRTAKTFGGWWTGAGGTGTQVTAATLVTNAAHHTLYAKWN